MVNLATADISDSPGAQIILDVISQALAHPAPRQHTEACFALDPLDR